MTPADFLKQHGCPDAQLDGQIHRFDPDGSGTDAGWYSGEIINDVAFITVGDWRTGEKHTYDASTKLDPEAASKFRKELEERKKAREAEKKQAQQKATERAQYLWDKSEAMLVGHPYLVKKGLVIRDGVRVYRGNLVVPLSRNGALVGLQFIQPDGTKKLLKGMNKKGAHYVFGRIDNAETIYICEGYATGASVWEASFADNTLQGAVVCALDSGNLNAVSTNIRRILPGADIFICADNDRFTTIKRNGKEVKYNVGLEKARAASDSIGARLVYPNFKGTGRETDFNDLHVTEGLGAVRLQLADSAAEDAPQENGNTDVHSANERLGAEGIDGDVSGGPQRLAGSVQKGKGTGTSRESIRSPESPANGNRPGDGEGAAESNHPTATGQDLRAMDQRPNEGSEPPHEHSSGSNERSLLGIAYTFNYINNFEWPTNAEGTHIKPGEGYFIRELTRLLRPDHISTPEGDMFKWHDTHWRMLDSRTAEQWIYRQIWELLRHRPATWFSPRIAERVARAVIKLLPQPPVQINMYARDRFKANFSNGTLHAGRGELHFKPHSRTDYCTYVIPIDYDETAENTEFEDMLDRILSGEPEQDRAEKRAIIQEMFGACVLPLQPRVFFLYGDPGCGKSTLLLLASKLLHSDNITSLDPCDFRKNFALAGSLGKLANIVTDIEEDIPIAKGVLKQIEDQAPIQVDRKFRDAVTTTLPPIHLWAGNETPTVRGGTAPLQRRMSFLQLGAYNSETDQGSTRNFAQKCFDDSPEGVLAFAVGGIRKLMASGGKYTKARTGNDVFAEMRDEHDPLGSLSELLKNGGVEGDSSCLIRGESSDIVSRKEIRNFIREYIDNNYDRWQMPTSHRIFRMLRGTGFQEVVVRGARGFRGLKIKPGQDSQY